MSLEGGTQKNRGADQGHQRLETAFHGAEGPEGTRAPPNGNTHPARATWARKRAWSLPRVTRPFSVGTDYRECCESATVTSTRWNSLSSL